MDRKQSYSRLATGAIIWSIALGCSASAQTRVDSYLHELRNLDNSRPESVCISRDSLHGLVAKANESERAEMFRAFRAFYIHSVDMTSPAFSAAMDKYIIDYEHWLMKSDGACSLANLLRERPDIAKAGSSWFECGFLMYDSEGSLYPVDDPASC
jgi:hypothetical protein